MIRRPSFGNAADGHRDMALGREFESIRKQILQDLLEPLGVRSEHWRQRSIDIHTESQVLRLCHVMERPLHTFPQRYESDLFRFDCNRSGLDLGKIENVVD